VQKMENVGRLLGLISALAAAIYAVRKFYFWLRPIVIEPSYTLILDNSGLDSISAKITNRSPSTQYLKSCVVRGTHPLKYILLRHLKSPFLSYKLYTNIWYGSTVYGLMGDTPIKLESLQLVTLKLNMYEHPLNAMYTPNFIVKVTLTSGRKISSKKLEAPASWQKIGRRGRPNPARKS